MSEVRPFRTEDVPAVAALFQRTFRDARRRAPDSLGAYIESVFLKHPWQDPEIASRVHVSDAGAVNGFIGILPLRLLHDGRPARAGLAGSLMVESPRTDPLAGAKLLRSFLNGPQDISLSETANPLSQRMWERAGGETIDGLSLDWLRVFRPSGLAVAVAGGRFRAARVLSPIARLFDRLGRRIAGDFLRATATADGTTGADLGEAEIAPHLLALTATTALRPDWDSATIRWFLQQAARKEERGPLRRRLVSDRAGKPIGCVLYYAPARGLGWVLHMIAVPGAEQRVIDELFAHADAEGLAGLRGRIQPAFQEPLVQRHAFLYRRAAFVARGKDAELVAALHGPAVVTGLAGESWIRLIGGRFS